MGKDVGRSPSGPGCQPSASAADASSLSGIPNAGDWALFRSNYERVDVDCRQIERVTPKLVKFVGSQWPRQCSILDLVASFKDEGTARRTADSIGGVAGEFNRRRRAANEEKTRRVTEALTAANRSVERIIASAMSAGTAETGTGSGPQDRQRDPKGDAQ